MIRSQSSSTVPAPFVEENRSLFSSDDDIIAVVGPAGSGKSSFIKISSGDDRIIINDNLEPSTIDIQAFPCLKPDNHDHNIVLLDTPGLNQSYAGDVDTLKAINDFLVKTYTKGTTLTGILFLHRISDPRVPSTLGRNPDIFEELWGPYGLQNVILVTTMWDDVESDTGNSRKNLLEAVYWKPMVKAGSCVLQFDGTYESAWRIIDHCAGVLGPLQKFRTRLDQIRGKSQKQLKPFRRSETTTDPPNMNALNTRSFVMTPKGKLSAIILALRDAQGVAKIYRLPSLKDALDLCLALAESIEILGYTEGALVEFTESIGQMIIEIADRIQDGRVPKGTQIADLIHDIVIELEKLDIEKLVWKDRPLLVRVRLYIQAFAETWGGITGFKGQFQSDFVEGS